jgi:hypothetical protein
MNKVLKYQIFHLLGFFLIGAALLVSSAQFPAIDSVLWGLSAFQWIIFSWIFAGLHQSWIVLLWRLEFYYQKISSRLGKAGFTVFRIGFVVFAGLRLLAVIPVSIATAHTMLLPLYVTIPLIVIPLPLIIWGLYSVFAYFGVNRAFGADHFDPSYRTARLEKRGIFKYIPNTMYTVVFLLLYHPGLFWQSLPGLITAAAHHLFVWLHYFCTEKPDMREIYGKR